MWCMHCFTTGDLLWKYASPVRDGSFDLDPVRKALGTTLGEASDSWYQRLQKLLILLHDSGQQS